MNSYLYSDAFINGNNTFDFVNGAIIAATSILVVFLILAIVIAITHFLFKGVNSVSEKLEAKKANQKEEPKQLVRQPVVIKDDDMMAAVLVATIDYQNEIKQGVRVVSVKEIN